MMSKTYNGARAAKRYCRQIHRELACSSKLKREFLDRVKANLDDFVELRPHASFDDLCERFGKPADVVEDFIVTLPAEELCKTVQRAKRIKAAVLIVCILYVLFLCGYYAYRLYNLKKSGEGFIIEEPAIVTETIYF